MTTTTQTSFSAFAVTQTEPGNFAVSDPSGLRGCFLPSSPYPLPKFRVHDCFPTGSALYIEHTSDGYPFACEGFLDAPDYLPSGGHRSMNFGGSLGAFSYFEVVAFAEVSRG